MVMRAVFEGRHPPAARCETLLPRAHHAAFAPLRAVRCRRLARLFRQYRGDALLEFPGVQEQGGDRALGEDPGAGVKPHSYQAWAIAEKRGNRCVGMVNYHHREPHNQRLEIGYILAPSQGPMTEALQALVAYRFESFGRIASKQ
jgi:RimJ/RimL family protein N-acetyltransferase